MGRRHRVLEHQHLQSGDDGLQDAEHRPHRAGRWVFTDAAIDFLKRAKEQNKPFFLWWNTTRMHIWTRLKPESQA
jgi:hypothetical protein